MNQYFKVNEMLPMSKLKMRRLFVDLICFSLFLYYKQQFLHKKIGHIKMTVYDVTITSLTQRFAISVII